MFSVVLGHGRRMCPFPFQGWSSEAEAMLRMAFRLTYEESAVDSSATRTRRLQSANMVQCARTLWGLLERNRSKVFPVPRTESGIISCGEPSAPSSKREGRAAPPGHPRLPVTDTEGGFSHMSLLPWRRPYLENAMMEQ